MKKTEIEAIIKKHNIPAYRYFSSIGSTNDEALRWVSDGAPEWAFVLAGAQTAGRGRQGRRWVTNPGASIAISIIIRPSPAEQQQLGLVSLAAGLALAQAIDSLCPRQNIQVKWPNDVLIEQKKTAGILAEAVWDQEKLLGVVIGIGINLLAAAVPPPSMLRYPATCLQAHIENEPEAIRVVDRLLSSLRDLRPHICADHFPSKYMERMAFLGQKISINTTEDKWLSGVLEGIDHCGNVLLRRKNGNLRSFSVGDVSLRPG